MKKGIIVLLMVLVAASAFAGFTGYVTFGGQYDLDSTDWGMYTNPYLKFTFNHKFAEGGAKGEGDIYAEIAAEMEVRDNGGTGLVTTAPGTSSYAAFTGSEQLRARITKASVFYKDWEFSILSAGGGYSYAKGAFLTDPYGYGYTPNVLSLTSAGNWKGVSAKYDGYTFGLYAVGNKDAETATIFAQAQTKTFKFADDAASAQAAGVFQIAKTATTTTTTIGASVKGSYSNDSVKANAAVDFQTVKADNDDNGAKIALEAYAKAVVLNDYTAEVYFANASAYDFEKASLNAKVSASFEVEEWTIDAAVTGYDILNGGYQLKTSSGSYSVGKTQRWAEVSVDAAYDVISAGAYYGLAVHKGDDFACNTGFGAYGAYSFEKFDVSAGVDFETTKAADPSITTIAPYAYLTSSAIINGATITIGYDSADWAKAGDEVIAKGCLYAQIKIKF